MSDIEITPETWAAWLALEAPPRPAQTTPLASPIDHDLPSLRPLLAKAGAVAAAFGAGMWGVWAGLAWLRDLANGDATFPAAAVLAVSGIVVVVAGCAAFTRKTTCPGAHCAGCADH